MGSEFLAVLVGPLNLWCLRSVGTPPIRLASFELKSGWEGYVTATLARAEICVSQLKECSDVKGNVHLGVLWDSSCSDDSWV